MIFNFIVNCSNENYDTAFRDICQIDNPVNFIEFLCGMKIIKSICHLNYIVERSSLSADYKLLFSLGRLGLKHTLSRLVLAVCIF